MELPSSLLWWELGTNLPGQGLVNNSDSDLGAFGYFLRTINWSSVDKSAQRVIKIPMTSLAGTQCCELLTDLYQWVYSCRIAGHFTSNFWSRACLTMPSLSGITIYRNTHFGPLIVLARHFSPIFCRFGPNSYDISPHRLESLISCLRSLGPLDFSAVFL